MQRPVHQELGSPCLERPFVLPLAAQMRFAASTLVPPPSSMTFNKPSLATTHPEEMGSMCRCKAPSCAPWESALLLLAATLPVSLRNLPHKPASMREARSLPQASGAACARAPAGAVQRRSAVISKNLRLKRLRETSVGIETGRGVGKRGENEPSVIVGPRGKTTHTRRGLQICVCERLFRDDHEPRGWPYSDSNKLQQAASELFPQVHACIQAVMRTAGGICTYRQPFSFLSIRVEGAINGFVLHFCCRLTLRERVCVCVWAL
mmetsp:Transcript_19520/g.39298  ORF Transcript_19520/g.39298 Transcript_19520/m.39298 type:complete len:264 (-) Transcript_19520:167-958(-)